MLTNLNYQIDNDDWEFGELLRTLRKEHSNNLTLDGMAAQVGLSRAALGKLENGETHPYERTIQELALFRRVLNPAPHRFAELAGAYAREWLVYIEANAAKRELTERQKRLHLPVAALVDLWESANDYDRQPNPATQTQFESAFGHALGLARYPQRIVVDHVEAALDIETESVLESLGKEFDLVALHQGEDAVAQLREAWVYITFFVGNRIPSRRWKEVREIALQLKMPMIGICLDEMALALTTIYDIFPLIPGYRSTETSAALLKQVHTLVELYGQIDWWNHCSHNQFNSDQRPKYTRIIGTAPLRLGDMFVGREEESTRLLELLTTNEHGKRLINIHGGKIGKTALACHVMRQLEERADAISCVVYVGDGNTFSEIALKLAAVSDPRIQQSFRNLMHSVPITQQINFLLETLNNKHVVILLDGFEKQMDTKGWIIDSGLREFIEAFLIRAPGGCLLVTSTQPLQLKAEAMLHIESFPLPQGLGVSDGVRLLRRVDNGRVLNTVPDVTLTQLVERANGLPQVLIHIHWLLSTPATPLTVTELLQNDALFYEEMINQLIQQVQLNLNEAERQVMQALSVVAHHQPHLPLTEAIIYAMLDFVPARQVRFAITALSQRDFIHRDAEWPFFKLYGWNQKFFYEELQTSAPDLWRTLEQKAARYYAEKVNRSEHAANYYSLKFVEVHHLFAAGDFDRALELLDALSADPLKRWDHNELIRHIEIEKVLAIRRELIGHLEDTFAARNWYGIAQILMLVGQYPDAQDCLKQVLDSASASDMELQIHTRLGLAWCQYQQQYYDQALTSYRQLLTQPFIENSPYLYSVCLNGLSCVIRDQGAPEMALEYCNQALAIARETGGEHGSLMVAVYLETQARIFRHLLRNKELISIYEELLQRQRQLHNQWEEISILSRYGMVLQDIGLWREEGIYQHWALELANQIGDYWGQAKVLERLANLYVALGSYDQAQTNAELGLKAATLINNRRKIAYCQMRFGQIYLAYGRFSEAEPKLLLAEELFETTRNAFDQQDSKNQLAKLYLFRGESDQALRKLNDALGCNIEFHNHQSLLLQAVALLAEGETQEQWIAVHDAFEQAADAAEKILIKTSRFYTARLTRALALTGRALLSDEGRRSNDVRNASIAWSDLHSFRAFNGAIGEGQRIFQVIRTFDTAQILGPLESVIAEITSSRGYMF